jgi:HK97 family phage portal protein
MSRLETLVVRGDDQPPARTWRDRLVDGWRGLWSGPLTSSSPELARLFSAGPVSAGVSVTETTALGVSAFFCAVSTISQDLASLPLFVFRTRPDGGKERDASHPLSVLLHDQPNPETTAFQFRAAMLVNVLSGGNAFAEIERDASDRPRFLWHLDPHRVRLDREAGVLRYRVRNARGDETVFDPRDILHLKGPSPDGVLGFNVVQLSRESLGVAIAAERFGARFFSNGSQLGGILSTPNALTEQAYKRLTETLMAQHQGVDRSHKWLLVDQGAEFTEVGVHPRDSQFNELRVHQIREVARFFRIPVSLLGDLERSTYANHEQEILKYFTNCLRPWLVNLEQEFNTKLLAPSDRGRLHCEHVVEGFLRADSEKRAAFYATMVSNGLMTPNEIRARENLPPIAGGDVPRAPMNTEPLSGGGRARSSAVERRAVDPAHRAMLADAVGRIVRQETCKARRAHATPEKLRAWMENFYPQHERRSLAMLHPAIAACGPDDPATATRAVVTQHIADSVRQLRDLLDRATTRPEAFPDELEALLVRWEHDRPWQAANAFLSHNGGEP